MLLHSSQGHACLPKLACFVLHINIQREENLYAKNFNQSLIALCTFLIKFLVLVGDVKRKKLKRNVNLSNTILNLNDREKKLCIPARGKMWLFFSKC